MQDLKHRFGHYPLITFVQILINMDNKNKSYENVHLILTGHGCVSEPDWSRTTVKLFAYMLAAPEITPCTIQWMKQPCFIVKFLIINDVKVYCHVRI